VYEPCNQLDGEFDSNVKTCRSSDLNVEISTDHNIIEREKENALKPKNIDRKKLIAVNVMIDHLIVKIRVIQP
jgi:hypothetical protein